MAMADGSRRMSMTKRERIGNSTRRGSCAASGLVRGDDVAVREMDGNSEVETPQGVYAAAMDAGRCVAARYRRAMAILAK